MAARSRSVPTRPPWLRAVQRRLPVGRTLSEAAWWRRHRAVLVLLWLHVPGIALYGVARGKGVGHSVLEASIVAATAAVATSSRPGRNPRTWAAALGLLSSSAVLVHLSGGLIEMHFHFFVMVAVVALYEDWVPFLLAVGYVLIHHGVMGALDPTSVYNHPAGLARPWRWAAVHALFIAGISVTCLITWRINETARAAEGAARRRLALVADASRTMASSLDIEVTLSELARLCVPLLADVCIVDLAEQGGTIRRVAVHATGVAGDLAPALLARPADPGDPSSPVTAALRTGRSQLIDVLSERQARALGGGAPEMRAALTGRSAIVVALPGSEGILGAIALITLRADATRAADDVSLAEELARRAAAAVENARRFAKERSVAETLQRSLLPERLPEIPGIATAVRYEPAGEGAEVGGDWYDVFTLPGGSIAIVMGDVIGRGIPAASLMGQLRNAIRAHAMDGLSPIEVVQKLNRLLQVHDPRDCLATLIYGVLDPGDGSLRLVNAGHPAPLMVKADGSASFGEDGLAAPLGALRHGRFHESAASLSAGDTLVLYTDGLVEDRRMPLGDGLERLRAAADADADVEALAERLMRSALGNRAVDDDAALLAVRLLPLGDRLDLRLPNDPSILASMRATLRRWLVRVGASPDAAFDVLVATGEACANAIEHAHGPGTATFEIEAVHDGGISVTVRDHGRWRSARSDGGGRGLQLMRDLMDRVDIVQGADGTEVRLLRGLGPQRIAS